MSCPVGPTALNAASRSPARVVFRHLAILPNPGPQGSLERRYDGDFQKHGLLNPRGPVSIRCQLNGQGCLLTPRDHWTWKWTKTVQSVPAKGRPATPTLFKTCRCRWGFNSVTTDPNSCLPVPTRRGRRAGTDPAPMPDPGITQSGLQTRGWFASGRGSLVVVGVAAPDRSPVYGEDGTEIEKAS